MASKALSLYLHPETRARIDAANGSRTAAEEIRLLAQVVSDIELHHRPELLDSEWNAVTATVAAMRYRVVELRDLQVLPAMIDLEMRRSRTAQAHGADPERLGFRLRQLRLPELLALWGVVTKRVKAMES